MFGWPEAGLGEVVLLNASRSADLRSWIASGWPTTRELRAIQGEGVHHRMDLGRDVEESNQPKQPSSWIGLVQHFIAPQEKARPRVRSGHCFAFDLSWKSTLAPTSKIY